MRNDKEQFEKIEQAYEAHEKVAMRTRRLTAVVVSVLLAVTLMAVSILVPAMIQRSSRIPGEGRADTMEEYWITNAGSKTTSEPAGADRYEYARGDLSGGEAYDAADVEVENEYSLEKDYSEADPVPASSSDEVWYYYGEASYGRDDPAAQLQAGTLTGAELCDRKDYQDYLEAVQRLIEYNEARNFDLYATRRVKVTVKNGDTPLQFVTVRLEDGNDRVIFTAQTDNKGEAYLFYGITQQSNDQYDHVVCTLGDETVRVQIEKIDSATGDVVEVQMKAGKQAQPGLDLMFMIDTTGSMGDELEYLKVEIRDIIRRIVGSQQYDVRTSVNFYRDEGDDYVVHATPFKTDAQDVYEIIRKEHAAGGGDTPEAVHTALDNAVNGHQWDENAVKLCFFVLDAPPHSSSEIYNSLRASVLAAAEKGIRIIPIVSSGSDSLTEYLMRTFALMTGGTYTFLTDDSGVGYSHSAPTTNEQYDVEKLNDLIVRIALEYME